MTNPALILLTAAILSASAIGVFAVQIQRLDPSGPDRLMPQSYAAGCAAYDVVIAALCFWAMHR